MPCTEKKVFSLLFFRALHAVPCPNNFSSVCFGCKNEVVDGMMCLGIFQNSFLTASGEPVAHPFDKKMVFILKSYFFICSQKIEGPFWTDLGGGGWKNKEIDSFGDVFP